MSSVIPEDVQQFFSSSIESVEEIELLLFLLRADGEEFTAADLAARLYIGEEPATRWLEQLAHAGLVGKDERDSTVRYQYAPASGVLDRTVRSLVRPCR